MKIYQTSIGFHPAIFDLPKYRDEEMHEDLCKSLNALDTVHSKDELAKIFRMSNPRHSKANLVPLAPLFGLLEALMDFKSRVNKKNKRYTEKEKARAAVYYKRLKLILRSTLKRCQEPILKMAKIYLTLSSKIFDSTDRFLKEILNDLKLRKIKFEFSEFKNPNLVDEKDPWLT